MAQYITCQVFFLPNSSPGKKIVKMARGAQSRANLKKIQCQIGKNGDFEKRVTFRVEDNWHFKIRPEEIGQLDTKLWGGTNLSFKATLLLL